MILHERADELFDGSFGRVPEKLARIDILVLDDFACTASSTSTASTTQVHGFHNKSTAG
jgi:hypothetical protein